MFSHAIVRTPSRSMIRGLTSANLGTPDYPRALCQHRRYVRALEDCGLTVTVLPADENFPDATFVEDTALLTPRCAVITRPGAASRRGESAAIQEAIGRFYATLERLESPGTLDGGDVMLVRTHAYVGLSGRTNTEGARQLIAILNRYGMTGSMVPLERGLHLKTGVCYLANNLLAASGEFLNNPQFQQFDLLPVADDERYAANCLWINGRVLVPEGFPKTRAAIAAAGYPTVPLAVSEFQKLDGGLTCLSLRF
ncbi:MAG: arginine deiminase-related protein [Desulfobacterales bacterium]